MELEICVDTVQSALQAIQGGADALELCCSLLEGGLTPSRGMVEKIVAIVAMQPSPRPVIRVMIRPRPGDFCYDELDVQVMENDIMTFKTLASPSSMEFVLGILTTTGEIDTVTLNRLVNKAYPYSVTFHRAVDMSNEDPELVVSKLAACSCNRILTSGFHATAMAGISTLQVMIKAAINANIKLAVAASIDEFNIRELYDKLGTPCTFHGSLRVLQECASQFRPHERFIVMGGEKINTITSEYQIKCASASRVAAARQALYGT